MTIDVVPDNGSADLLAGKYISVYTAPSTCISAVMNARMVSRNLAVDIKVRMAVVSPGDNWVQGGIQPPPDYCWIQPLDLVLGQGGITVGMLEDTGIVLKPGESVVMYCDNGFVTGRVHGLVRTPPLA